MTNCGQITFCAPGKICPTAIRQYRLSPFREIIMLIPAIRYRGLELSAYARQVFLPVDTPYAMGPRRYSSVVSLDSSVPPRDSSIHRYSTVFVGTAPVDADTAIALAMRFGRDIIDGKIKAHAFIESD